MKVNIEKIIGKLILLLLLIAFTCPVIAEFSHDTAEFSHDTEQRICRLLHIAVSKAFRNRLEFEDSGVFQLLGYSNKDLEALGYITPRPASISIEIELSDSSGRFKYIKVYCSDIRYYNMTIERAMFAFPACEIDITALENGLLRFKSAKKIELKIEVSENDMITAFASVSRTQGLRNMNIRLSKDRARVSGRMRKGMIVVDFRLYGNTKLIDPKTINFRCDKLIMNGKSVPRNTVNAIFGKINPVFNTKNHWLNLNVSKIKIESGFVKTFASIDRKVADNTIGTTLKKQ